MHCLHPETTRQAELCETLGFNPWLEPELVTRNSKLNVIPLTYIRSLYKWPEIMRSQRQIIPIKALVSQDKLVVPWQSLKYTRHHKKRKEGSTLINNKELYFIHPRKENNLRGEK